MKFYAVLALIAIVLAPVHGNDDECLDVFFRVSRVAGSCQDFFVCMVGGRVDFSCDPGFIFDEERIQCRTGSTETCEFIAPEIPENECENDFLRIAPHPDPDRCMTFFACLNFNLIVFNCDDGYIFSEYAQRCIPGSHETCEEDALTPYQKLLKNSSRKQ